MTIMSVMGKHAVEGKAELVERIVPVPPEILAKFRAYERDSRCLYSRREELRDRYPDQWVAVHDGHVYHASSVDDLIQVLRRAGLESGTIPREFLPREPLLVTL